MIITQIVAENYYIVIIIGHALELHQYRYTAHFHNSRLIVICFYLSLYIVRRVIATSSQVCTWLTLIIL